MPDTSGSGRGADPSSATSAATPLARREISVMASSSRSSRSGPSNGAVPTRYRSTQLLADSAAARAVTCSRTRESVSCVLCTVAASASATAPVSPKSVVHPFRSWEKVAALQAAPRMSSSRLRTGQARIALARAAASCDQATWRCHAFSTTDARASGCGDAIASAPVLGGGGVDRGTLAGRQIGTGPLVGQCDVQLVPLRLGQVPVHQPATDAKPVVEEGVPQPDRRVPTRGGQELPGGGEHHRVHGAGVPGEHLPVRATGGDVPEPRRLVRARRGEQAPVRAERHVVDRSRVTGQGCTVRLASRGVPQPYGLVGTRGGDQPAVRTEGNAEDLPSVAGQGSAVRLAGADVP